MNRGKGWIWISLALVCAIGAGVLSFYVLGQEAQAAQARATLSAAPTAVPIPTMRVPVAAKELQAGAILVEGDYALKDFPVDLVPSNAITDTEKLAKQTLVQPVAAGDIFRSETLLGGNGAPLSGQIETGKTLFALPVVDLMGGSGLVSDGDHVDLMLSLDSANKDTGASKTTGYTIQNVQVFRVLAPPKTEQEPNPKPNGYMLVLAPKDAVLVKATKDAGGTIDMALRSPSDSKPFDAPAITTEQLEAKLRSGGQR